MEKFLEELRNALNDDNVENSEEIIAKYLKHFSLGHEAGMTDEEIIERFESIEDIVMKASKAKKDSSLYNIILDLDCFSDFKIVRDDEISGVEFDIEEDAFKYCSIIREGNTIHLKSKIFKTILRQRTHFEGKMHIGSDVKFDQFNINNVNCDIACDFKMECCDFSLSNVSGDVVNCDIIAEESIIINNTSGDVDLLNLDAPKIKVSNVSGDITIDELTADTVKLSTISGDIIIQHATDAEFSINTVSGDVRIEEGADDSKIKSSTVSGDIKINGKVISKSISDKIKNSFKW